MRIGIIGAMDVEVRALKEIMEDCDIEKISSVDFFKGKISGLDTVVATAGVGKVNAAVCAQTMILKYSPDYLINIGVAGGLSPELGIGDIAVADTVVEHDMDTTPLGDAPGFITGLDTVYINCSKKLSEMMYKASKSIDGINTVCGTIASGDQFIASNEQREKIKNTFKNTVAAEMEGASIGHVCKMNGVEFGVLRAISDGANSDSKMDFPTFTQMAAKNSIKIILELIKELAE